MKRKDWKIKKLKKNIYGKFFKRKRIFFLRKLFLRKNLVFLRKNLVMHYLLYRKFHNSIRSSKKNKIVKLFITKSNYIHVFPNFFLSKKIFNNHIFFKSFAVGLGMNFFFINNLIKNFFHNSSGNNFIIFSDKINWDNFLKASLLEENKDLIKIKSNFFNSQNANQINNFNFLLNFNIVIMQNIEIYKILIFLYLNNIYKINKKYI